MSWRGFWRAVGGHLERVGADINAPADRVRPVDAMDVRGLRLQCPTCGVPTDAVSLVHEGPAFGPIAVGLRPCGHSARLPEFGVTE